MRPFVLNRTLKIVLACSLCAIFFWVSFIVGLCARQFVHAILFALHSFHKCTYLVPAASVATAALTEFKTKLSTSSSEEDKFIAQTGVEVYEAMSFALNKK